MLDPFETNINYIVVELSKENTLLTEFDDIYVNAKAHIAVVITQNNEFITLKLVPILLVLADENNKVINLSGFEQTKGAGRNTFMVKYDSDTNTFEPVDTFAIFPKYLRSQNLGRFVMNNILNWVTRIGGEKFTFELEVTKDFGGETDQEVSRRQHFYEHLGFVFKEADEKIVYGVGCATKESILSSDWNKNFLNIREVDLSMISQEIKELCNQSKIEENLTEENDIETSIPLQQPILTCCIVLSLLLGLIMLVLSSW